jgi:polyisoprenoid-binding protein YceI
MRWKNCVALVLCTLGIFSPCLAQKAYRISPKSVIQIHLDASGFLGFLGDKHLIEAPIARGRVHYSPENLEKSSVDLEVSSKDLRVKDPGLEEKKRQEVQQTMESPRVLEIAKYPRIAFKSAAVKSVRADTAEITGDLTLRDNTRRVKVLVKVSKPGPRLEATGSCHFKQTDFGMKPVTAGGGTVRVKDEVKLTFKVYADAE